MNIFLQLRPVPSSYGTRTPQSDHVALPFSASSANQMVSNYQQRQQSRTLFSLNIIEMLFFLIHYSWQRKNQITTYSTWYKMETSKN